MEESVRNSSSYSGKQMFGGQNPRNEVKKEQPDCFDCAKGTIRQGDRGLVGHLPTDFRRSLSLQKWCSR